jgi:hypothetical protein
MKCLKIIGAARNPNRHHTLDQIGARILLVKTNFMFNCKVKLTPQQSKMTQIHWNNKIAIVAQWWGDDGNGQQGPQPTTYQETDDAD